jgi:RND family efflux transporter MFP subunit
MKAQKFILKIKQWFLKKPLWAKAALIGGALLLVVGIASAGGEDYANIETVQRQTLLKTIAASGTVVSSTDLSLSFESSRVIESVRVSVGSRVKKGDILSTQKAGNERASYNAARGSLLAAEARYQKVLEGSSNEEIALAKAKLETTKKVQDGLVENARRKLLSEGLIAEPRSSAVDVIPTVQGIYIGSEGEYRISSNIINGFYITYSGLESGRADIVRSTDSARLGTKGLSLKFSDTDAIGNDMNWIVKIPNTTSSAYTENKNAYDAAIAARDAAIAVAQAELDLKRATARQSEIDAALADIVSARAQVEQAQATLEKTILRAPADGTITAVKVKVGEVPAAYEEAFVLQDVSNLYLEALVNESNVSLLREGQGVTVTLDAFGSSKTYTATLSSIDPAATITDGVVNYKVKALLGSSEEIRPGMTANMLILARETPGALVIPGRALKKTNGVYSVELLPPNRGEPKTQTVTIGLRGDGDLVEILSGLAEGDRVVWGVK